MNNSSVKSIFRAAFFAVAVFVSNSFASYTPPFPAGTPVVEVDSIKILVDRYQRSFEIRAMLSVLAPWDLVWTKRFRAEAEAYKKVVDDLRALIDPKNGFVGIIPDGQRPMMSLNNINTSVESSN